MGFCRAKFWAKFPFWRGAVWGEVFREVCREVFHEVFGLVLLGHSEQKNISKNFSPKFPWPCTGNFKNLLMPLFLMGCFPVDFQEGKRPIKVIREKAH